MGKKVNGRMQFFTRTQYLLKVVIFDICPYILYKYSCFFSMYFNWIQDK